MRRHSLVAKKVAILTVTWSLSSRGPLAWAVLAAAIAAGASRPAAAEKAGYEFFSTAHGETTHIADVPVFVLLATAPNANWIWGQGEGVPKQRIIDIKIEESGPLDSDWCFTALLLKNTGVYQRDSWLIWNLTEESVQELQQIIDWIPLDIEATWYKNHRGDYVKRYAVVMVANPEKWYWEFAINVKQSHVDNLQYFQDMRPIDLDAFDDSLWPFGVPEESYLRFNGVFVENTGENYLSTIAMFVTEEHLDDFYWLGYHVIDVQGLPENLVPFVDKDIGWHVVMVQNFNTWWTMYEKSSVLHEFTQNNPSWRMVDLKRYGTDKFRATFIPQKD